MNVSLAKERLGKGTKREDMDDFEGILIEANLSFANGVDPNFGFRDENSGAITHIYFNRLIINQSVRRTIFSLLNSLVGKGRSCRGDIFAFLH